MDAESRGLGEKRSTVELDSTGSCENAEDAARRHCALSKAPSPKAAVHFRAATERTSIGSQAAPLASTDENHTSPEPSRPSSPPGSPDNGGEAAWAEGDGGSGDGSGGSGGGALPPPPPRPWSRQLSRAIEAGQAARDARRAASDRTTTRLPAFNMFRWINSTTPQTSAAPLRAWRNAWGRHYACGACGGAVGPGHDRLECWRRRGGEAQRARERQNERAGRYTRSDNRSGDTCPVVCHLSCAAAAAAPDAGGGSNGSSGGGGGGGGSGGGSGGGGGGGGGNGAAAFDMTAVHSDVLGAALGLWPLEFPPEGRERRRVARRLAATSWLCQPSQGQWHTCRGRYVRNAQLAALSGAYGHIMQAAWAAGRAAGPDMRYLAGCSTAALTALIKMRRKLWRCRKSQALVVRCQAVARGIATRRIFRETQGRTLRPWRVVVRRRRIFRETQGRALRPWRVVVRSLEGMAPPPPPPGKDARVAGAAAAALGDMLPGAPRATAYEVIISVHDDARSGGGGGGGGGGSSGGAGPVSGLEQQLYCFGTPAVAPCSGGAHAARLFKMPKGSRTLGWHLADRAQPRDHAAAAIAARAGSAAAVATAAAGAKALTPASAGGGSNGGSGSAKCASPRQRAQTAPVRALQQQQQQRRKRTAALRGERARAGGGGGGSGAASAAAAAEGEQRRRGAAAAAPATAASQTTPAGGDAGLHEGEGEERGGQHAGARFRQTHDNNATHHYHAYHHYHHHQHHGAAGGHAGERAGGGGGRPGVVWDHEVLVPGSKPRVLLVATVLARDAGALKPRLVGQAHVRLYEALLSRAPKLQLRLPLGPLLHQPRMAGLEGTAAAGMGGGGGGGGSGGGGVDIDGLPVTWCTDGSTEGSGTLEVEVTNCPAAETQCGVLWHYAASTHAVRAEKRWALLVDGTLRLYLRPLEAHPKEVVHLRDVAAAAPLLEPALLERLGPGCGRPAIQLRDRFSLRALAPAATLRDSFSLRALAPAATASAARRAREEAAVRFVTAREEAAVRAAVARLGGGGASLRQRPQSQLGSRQKATGGSGGAAAAAHAPTSTTPTSAPSDGGSGGAGGAAGTAGGGANSSGGGGGGGGASSPHGRGGGGGSGSGARGGSAGNCAASPVRQSLTAAAAAVWGCVGFEEPTPEEYMAAWLNKIRRAGVSDEELPPDFSLAAVM
ncbi:hypothetical protein JKP88DRAFT_334360 [Tribonema minus]|uniref:Uncharacterized protein n=1 Tax=Tribonema minus TaxID=303371 RepID=A0A835YLE9_9STRA|nr:hypothetical protein JKP88DRAFT_334360 [Tribonema minus]